MMLCVAPAKKLAIAATLVAEYKVESLRIRVISE
jgi:hypothetical protein